MALLTYNGTNFDSHLGSASIGGTNVNFSLTGSTSLGCTAPNTTNKATGVWIAIASATNAPNDIKVELLESGVVKATAYILQADHVIGFNYVRFTTPYQFTTTAANAYTVKLYTTSTNSGSVRAVTAGNIWYQLTYDSGVSIGANDDIMIGGFNNSGLTPQTYTYTGTSGSWGSGTAVTWSSTTLWDMASPIIIGSGGNFVFDTTANTTLTVKGAILVYKGGKFDMRPGASYVNTLIFNQNGTDGNYGILSPTSGYGGQILTTGTAPTSYVAQYASGTGTAANPLVTQANHGFVVDQEIVIPGLTYSTSQVRYVKSIPAANQLVLSATIGGAESAITNTPAVGAYIAQMTRNSIIKNTGTTQGFWIFNSNTNTTPLSDFKYTRFEYANCSSGRGLNFNGSSTLSADANDADFSGSVFYNNSAAGRNSITWNGKAVQTVSNIVMYNTKGSNYSAQSGLVLTGTNKTLSGLYHYPEPSSTTNCGGLSLSSTATSNTIRNFHSYGGNAVNGTLGYALGIFGIGNTIEDSTINSSRVCGIRGEGSINTAINNCNFAAIGTNTIDINLASSTLNTMLFSNCTFGSATLVSNYTNCLEGTDIAFQDLDGNTSKHRWYTNRGSFWSSGSGLTDTTTRTAGSLSLAIKPEDASNGATTTFKIPANPESNVQIYGYMYRNATFSSGDITVDLFLPGTLLTDTPDDSYTLTTSTGAWQLWTLNAYNSGSVARYATVRITAKTATAGAYVFLDDIYDAELNNKVAGLDLWDEGHISPIMLALDLSALPEQTRVAVWSDNATYDTGEKGQVLQDAADDAELASIK